MRRYVMVKKVMHLLLVAVIILSVSFVSAAQQQPADTISEQQQAIIDAKRDAKSINVSAWAFGGCLLPGITIIVANTATPPIPLVKLIGKSPDYIAFYTDTYQQEVTKKRSSAAVGGCVGGTFLYALLIVAYNTGSIR